MEAIPVPTRKRIIALYDQGESTEEIAERVGYCVAAVRRVRQHFHERGTLEPQTHRCGRTGSFTDELQQRLRDCVARRPDATLAELRDAMKLDVAISTVDRWTKRLGLSFKKSRSAPASSGGRT
jgi:transposase